jgi:hypothetical protein
VDTAGAEASSRAAGEIGRLAIGFTGSATYQLLPRLARVLRKDFPGIDLDLKGRCLLRTRSPRYWIGPWTALILSAVSPAAPRQESTVTAAHLVTSLTAGQDCDRALPTRRLALLRVEQGRATPVLGPATDTAPRTRYSREEAACACGVVGCIGHVAAAAA